MFYEILGVGVIAIVALLGRVLEDSKRIWLRSPNGQRALSTEAAYECFNLHLHISLGMLGLAWAALSTPATIVILFILIMGGIMSKGTFSFHEPERLGYKDRDALFGLWIPNLCALIAVLFVGLMLIVGPGHKTQSQSQPSLPATSPSNNQKPNS